MMQEAGTGRHEVYLGGRLVTGLGRSGGRRHDGLVAGAGLQGTVAGTEYVIRST
jgi:hypothetical protein